MDLNSLYQFGLNKKIVEVVSSTDKSSDVATWIGAIGTVGTLIGAIYLASKQKIESDKVKRGEAVLLCISFHSQLQMINMKLNAFMAVIDAMKNRTLVEPRKPNSYKPNADSVEKLVDFLKQMPKWDAATIVPLLILNNGSAPAIATGRYTIDQVIEMIEIKVRNKKHLTEDGRAEIATTIYSAFNSAKSLLKTAEAVCKSELMKADFNNQIISAEKLFNYATHKK